VDNLFETTPDCVLRYRILAREKSGTKVDEDVGMITDNVVEGKAPRCARDHKTSYWLVGGVVAGAVAGGFALAGVFFLAGFGAGSVSSTITFFGGGGGAADRVLT
jgi:hypothetical protein